MARSSFASCGLAALALAAILTGAGAQGTSADERLRALYTAEWEWRRREMARRSDAPGEAGAADHLPRVDAASQQARLGYWTRTLAALDSIPFDSLSPAERDNAEVFRTSLRALANDVRFRTYEAPLNSDTFFWTEFTPRQGFASVDVYRNFLARLRDVPRFFDENVANMRAGMARGFTVPRVSVTGRDRTVEPYLKADSTNPIFTPFADMPPSIPAAEQASLRRDALAVIRDVIVPAYTRLLVFIRNEYLPNARTTLAATATPDGAAYYQAMIEKFTTLTLTPREIHDIGLGEVARIRAEMEAVKQRAGFTGTMAEFFTFLRTDPQFYAKTPRELLSYSAYVSKKADWKLAETIGFLPRRRHGIRPVPEALAPIYTGGRGGLEACLMNTYNLPARPLYTIPPLTLHECTPGHSFQAALALEGPERPPFRRGTSFSAFQEGWGLYTEWLGTIMGIYETPYEDFGRLTYEMWRAARLVIDTGIHAFGWSRERAMAYLREHAALAEHEITTEVERYIAWPGQALAYKLGELQIRRHRREAEEKLGAAFDQRKFHDAILALGSVPLSVLERRMAQFIAGAGDTTSGDEHGVRPEVVVANYLRLDTTLVWRGHAQLTIVVRSLEHPGQLMEEARYAVTPPRGTLFPPEFRRSTTTRGVAVVDSLPAGPYEVHVAPGIGYTLARVPITLTPGCRATLEVYVSVTPNCQQCTWDRPQARLTTCRRPA